MDKATELAKVIDWARAHGVTPELRVRDARSLCREVLAPVYKALTGAELPVGASAGSEKCLAEGRANVGAGAGNESAWEEGWCPGCQDEERAQDDE